MKYCKVYMNCTNAEERIDIESGEKIGLYAWGEVLDERRSVKATKKGRKKTFRSIKQACIEMSFPYNKLILQEYPIKWDGWTFVEDSKVFLKEIDKEFNIGDDDVIVREKKDVKWLDKPEKIKQRIINRSLRKSE